MCLAEHTNDCGVSVNGPSGIVLVSHDLVGQGFSNGALTPPGHRAVLQGHKQRPLLNSSAVIFQNPIDEQGATSVEGL